MYHSNRVCTDRTKRNARTGRCCWQVVNARIGARTAQGGTRADGFPRDPGVSCTCPANLQRTSSRGRPGEALLPCAQSSATPLHEQPIPRSLPTRALDGLLSNQGDNHDVSFTDLRFRWGTARWKPPASDARLSITTNSVEKTIRYADRQTAGGGVEEETGDIR